MNLQFFNDIQQNKKLVLQSRPLYPLLLACPSRQPKDTVTVLIAALINAVTNTASWNRFGVKYSTGETDRYVKG